MRSGFLTLVISLLTGLLAVLTSIFLSFSRPASPPPSVSPSSTPTPTIIPTLTPTSTPVPLSTSTPRPPTLPPVASRSGSVTVSTPKGNFSATVLSIDLTTAKMLTDTADDSDCSANCATLSLKDFVTRNSGFAGVNGTYFCPAAYPDCSAKKDSFDFPVYNSRLHKWLQADKLGWSERRAIIYVDGSGAHYLNSSAGFSGGLTAGIVNYPGLVDGGQVQIDDNQSGLSDKQRAVGTKVGIGTKNPNNLLVVVAQNVNMQQFAYVFQSLGAVGALNLDTGGSTALYNGGYIYGPGRNLPNAVIFSYR